MSRDDCGTVLSDIQRLQKRVKEWCPAGVKRNADDEPTNETARPNWLPEHDSDMSDSDEDEMNVDLSDIDDKKSDDNVTSVVYGNGIGKLCSSDLSAEKWRRHFQHMAEGKVKPNHKGHYIV